MAFGISKNDLLKWKKTVERGEIAIITHFWYDERFPGIRSVTKIGCSDVKKLEEWGKKYQLLPKWIHHRKKYPHFDVMGEKQREILMEEELEGDFNKFV